MLAPGQYVLRERVRNPNGDRRQRYDWRREAGWDAGTKFLVIDDPFENHPEVPNSVIRLVGCRYSHQVVMRHGSLGDLYLALESALIPSAEDVDGMLSRLRVDDHFARWLLNSGVVQRELFERLWAEYQELDSVSSVRLVERPS